MDEFNERLEKIRGLLVKMKAKEYAVTNETLSGLDEYVKKLYLKLLGTVIQYKNDPSDMQILYLNRIACGMGAEEPVEELMRMALEISETDVQEFLSVVKEKNIKFYFALDGLLLLKMGNVEQENYEYLGELLELCDVTKNDIGSVSLIAKSVLLQESSYYDEAKKWIAEYAKTYDFSSYIKTYYAGAIVDLQDKKRYSSPNVNQVYDISFPTLYEEKKVLFENLNIHLNEEWKFEGCEEVVFRNCKIYGGNGHFSMLVGSVVFENCVCENFGNRVANIGVVYNFIVRKCEFRNCGHINDMGSYNSDRYGGGGVFDLTLYSTNDNIETDIELRENIVKDCYLITQHREVYQNGYNGAFLAALGTARKFVVKNNEFHNCKCEGYKYEKALIDYGNNRPECIEENNKCTGELTNIFGD